MANRIPRNASRLEVTWLHGSNACPAGTKTEAYKDEYGWHMKYDRKTWYIFPSMLRNEDVCSIKVIA